MQRGENRPEETTVIKLNCDFAGILQKQDHSANAAAADRMLASAVMGCFKSYRGRCAVSAPLRSVQGKRPLDVLHPCAGCRQLPFCRLAIWGHLALQAVPSRQVS